MGIPYYFYLLTQTHANILAFQPPAGDHLRFFLDFNGAVYNAYYERLAAGAGQPTEAEICADTWAYFQRLVEAVGAGAGRGASVAICMDGVAPVAKMVQQRRRRFMTMARDQLGGTSGAGGAPAWDTNAISPGTPFMRELTAYLKRQCADQPNVTFSGPDEPGEGEHKIFATLAASSAPGPVVIYGLDADLIMLSLLSHVPGIHLMREPAQVRAGMGTDAPFVYLRIDALRAAILRNLAERHRWAVTPAALADPYGPEACHWIENYVALCFFMGNDFLPALPTLHMKGDGLETLLKAYEHARSAAGEDLVVAEGSVPGLRKAEGSVPGLSYTFIAALLQILAKDEDARVRSQTEEYVRRRAHASKPEERLEFYPILPENKDPVAQAILGPGPWRTAYYEHLFYGAAVPEACALYLAGLAWTYRYYKRQPKDEGWSYPHGYAPATRDLADVAQAQGAALAALPTGPAAPAFVSTDVQLLCILPIKSRALLPARLQPFMTDPAYGCAHLYPRTFRLRTYMKTRLWECVPVLPPLDVAWIQEALVDA